MAPKDDILNFLKKKPQEFSISIPTNISLLGYYYIKRKIQFMNFFLNL